MFKVLKVDGPHILTDHGVVGIIKMSYADGGKTQPVDTEDWMRMRDLFIAAPDLLAACEAIMEFLSNGTPVHPGALVQAEVFNAIRKAKGGAS